jgi:purine catabolism regulator
MSSRAAPPLTIADALALPILRRALPEVVAGEDNLHRPLRWVHVLDVDPADLLRGGELVLSTGAGPGPDSTGQRRFVRALAEERAAGLIIELGMSYRQELPAALVAEAADRALPLIALHRPVRFVDVTEAIHGALVDRQLALLRRGQETGERLTGLVLERRGLGELLHEIARTVGNPVMLENLATQLVAFAVHESSEEELLEAREEHRLARDRGETSGRGWLAADVRLRGRPWGQLVALELDRALGEEDRIAVERAAVAVALELLHEQHEEQLRARSRGTFLVDLMQERLQETDAARRAAALDFPRRHGRLLPAALAWRSERWVEVADSPEDAWAALMPSLRAAIGSHRPALLGLHAGRMLLVISVGETDPSEETLQALAEDLRRPLIRRSFGVEDVTISFGAGAGGWLEVGRRLQRASQAVGAARASAPTSWHDARRGSIVDLLYAIRASPELLTFAREQLGVLFEERDQRERELLRTLEIYLASGGRKAEAARLLHLERQSLYLRLQRVEQLLGVDLDDPDTVLGLHLAVRALRVTQALGPQELLGRHA